MDLNHLELSGQLINKLYKTELVNLAFKDTSSNDKVQFTGNNKKNILVAINASDPDKKDQELLSNLLVACKLTLNDIALVNFHGQQTSVQNAADELNISKVILFGIKPEPGLTKKKYEIVNFNNMAFLIADELKDLHRDVEKKKQLWQCLRQLFKI